MKGLVGIVELGGVLLEVRPSLLRHTRAMLEMESPFGRPVFLVWSLEVARILLAPLLSGVTFAVWHDDRFGCATWTDAVGCRCEVDA